MMKRHRYKIRVVFMYHERNYNEEATGANRESLQDKCDLVIVPIPDPLLKDRRN